jgi:RimJ/RimL family protein N-acetyltransferase
MAPVTAHVVPSIVKWAENPSNSEFFRRCPPLMNWLTPEVALALWGSSWVILEDDMPVGLVTMANLEQSSRSCEYGILVDKEASSHPRFTIDTVYHEALEHAFDYCNLHKVYVKILDTREKLAAIAASFGFSQEAVLRDSIFYKGEYRNEILLSCLKLEYRRRS